MRHLTVLDGVIRAKKKLLITMLQAMMYGPPRVGKSTLVSRLTGAPLPLPLPPPPLKSASLPPPVYADSIPVAPSSTPPTTSDSTGVSASSPPAPQTATPGNKEASLLTTTPSKEVALLPMATHSTGVANKVIQVVAKKASFVLAKAVQPGVAWEILHFDLEAIGLLKSMANVDDDTLALQDDLEPISQSSSEDEEGSEVSEKLSKKQMPKQSGKRSGKRSLFRFGRMKGKAHSASRKQALDVKLPMEIFQEALRSKKWEAAQALLEGSFTIYFTDTGGQPEFQELLPALTSGPSVFFLVFRISDSLHETYRVEYVRPTSEKSASYSTSFTLKEALMQSLASISSICSYSSRKSKTMVMIRSKVILVGTHSDKASAEHIRSVQRELKEILQNTDYYKNGIIAFSSRDEPVVVVNNLAEADIQNQKIRSIVENLAKDPCYQVSTPAPWYVLALALRSLSVPVVSMEQCLGIAEECGISDEEELKEALWFLHTKLGLLRYFGEIEELSAIVICNPQLIFEKVTDLITSTFTFEETRDPYGEEKFKKLGIISKELIERILATDNSILTCKHLLVLLEHLDIVAPIRNDAGEIIEYFMPSALSL